MKGSISCQRTRIALFQHNEIMKDQNQVYHHYPNVLFIGSVFVTHSVCPIQKEHQVRSLEEATLKKISETQQISTKPAFQNV